MEKIFFRKSIFIPAVVLSALFFAAPFFVKATTLDFNVQPDYDYLGRQKVPAFLEQAGSNAYFYVEDDYFSGLDQVARNNFAEAIKNLSQEFDSKIYPQLRDIYGSEWKPGIDNDDKITVFISRMKVDRGGYFNPTDEYPKLQIPTSNEREMVYLNAQYIDSPLAKSYLAHEFTHLITFNQKDNLYKVSEETWLNEARAELAPTLLGYDDNYQGSNLQKRVRAFAENPGDSLTDWQDTPADYGVANLFLQYVLEKYGVRVLRDSMVSAKIGIPSINEALRKEGYAKDFSQVFTDWTIAVLVNDCSLGEYYCYLNPNLKNLAVLPQLNYLPLAGESTLSVTNYTNDWAGNWFKFIGGHGALKLEFAGDSDVTFKAPYLLRDSSGKYYLNYLSLNSSQLATVFISNFGSQYNSMVLIPSIQSRTSGFDGVELYHKFLWSISVTGSDTENQTLINSLLAQIDSLKKQIAAFQVGLPAGQAGQNTSAACSQISGNLYYGLKNNQEVRCLQSFLKSQGQDIYPEGLVTGNFLSATKQAVIRFQAKYASEILTPSGLQKGTGFVGIATKTKINQLLAK